MAQEIGTMPAIDASQTNALLGYPSASRLLILNADDFGMCHAINAAILRTLQEGIVSSTTVMVPCPWAAHAMRLLKAHPGISFGVHLTLICEFGDYRWGPVVPKGAVPSLVAEDGHFFSDQRRDELLARATLAEVEAEFRAQIDAVLAARLAPTHLDWHCLADGGRGDIFDLTLRLAREYGLALRVHDRPAAAQCRSAGLPTIDHPVLDSYALETANKAARYVQLLRALPPGLSEWAVHPSLGDAEAQAMEPESWRVRKADFDFFSSRAARELLDEEGITLLNYRALQRHATPAHLAIDASSRL